MGQNWPALLGQNSIAEPVEATSRRAHSHRQFFHFKERFMGFWRWQQQVYPDANVEVVRH
jgi:hypothetical protein